MTKIRKAVPKKRLIFSAVFIVLGVCGILLARNAAGFADFYGFNIYPVIEAVFGFMSGLLPFSLAEILVIFAVLLLLAGIVYLAVRLIKRRGGRLKFLASSLSTLLLCLSVLLFDFVYCSGINYYRTPFSVTAGFTTEKYTVEQLREVLEYVIDELNIMCEAVSIDDEGHVEIPDSVINDARAAMTSLSNSYPSLSTYYPRVKPVMMSELMSYGHIVGMFTFYTMEANYNTSDVAENIGHTMCHELSHLTGFMREDEANFISYIACRDSGSAYLRYSGLYSILVHLLNAYYPEVKGEEYNRVMSLIDERVYRQICLQNEYWDKYETDFGEAAEAMNDTYLKINAQTDGTKSYGRVVDLVIADYYANKR